MRCLGHLRRSADRAPPLGPRVARPRAHPRRLERVRQKPGEDLIRRGLVRARLARPLTAILPNADPACNINIDTILGDLTALNTGGVGTSSFPIPNTPGLAGFVITGQSICLTLQNASNLLTSNGIQGVLGY